MKFLLSDDGKHLSNGVLFVCLLVVIYMLKACSKCGKIHERGYKCTAGIVVKQERNSQADKFRNTSIWRQKSEDIKKRDMHLCRICLTRQYNTILQYNAHKLSVHHIVPLNEDFDMRLDDDNLITLCSYHHELAEHNRIPRRLLRDLARTPPALSPTKAEL